MYNLIGPSLINNALLGYNNTVFCYGQTGSGKTYTMSGSKLWKERGLIPRFIVDLYKKIKSNSAKLACDIYISYLEIYNENAYDLLDIYTSNSNDVNNIKKIIVYEDSMSNIVMKNLNTVKVTNEKQALDLFMTGNYNRSVSSTLMNNSSSRSHAIFSIIIEGRNKDTEKIFTSKINLVDLAGSERLNKSANIHNNINCNTSNSFYYNNNNNNTSISNFYNSFYHDNNLNNTFYNTNNSNYNNNNYTFNEAKYINLSLSFLEQVIIALNERNKGNRVHIPYRNSLMTTILKDSLGGNCKTVLIANCSVELWCLDETLSTLRFAIRCSKIENEITINEQMDLNVLVNKLIIENEELRKKVNNSPLKSNNNKILNSINNNKYSSINKDDNNICFVENKILGLSEKDECKIIINDYINKITPTINTKNINKLYFIIDYLIEYINNKEKIYKEKLSKINTNITFSKKHTIEDFNSIDNINKSDNDINTKYIMTKSVSSSKLNYSKDLQENNAFSFVNKFKNKYNNNNSITTNDNYNNIPKINKKERSYSLTSKQRSEISNSINNYNNNIKKYKNNDLSLSNSKKHNNNNNNILNQKIIIDKNSNVLIQESPKNNIKSKSLNKYNNPSFKNNNRLKN